MYRILIHILLLIGLVSCRPVKESYYLPTVNFNLTVINDTAFIKLGDTFFLDAIQSTTRSNGLKIDDGILSMRFSIYYYDTTPIPTTYQSSKIPKLNHTLNLYFRQGSFSFKDQINSLSNLQLNAATENDSFRLSFGIIPLEEGTYSISIRDGKFESEIGNSGARLKFLFHKQHAELFEGDYSNIVNNSSSNVHYYTTYTFAVIK